LLPTLSYRRHIARESIYIYIQSYDRHVAAARNNLKWAKCVFVWAPLSTSFFYRKFATRIHINRYNRTDVLENSESFFNENEFQHPLFEAATFKYDYMVIKLSGLSKATPVLLNSDSAVPTNSLELTAIGWGDTDPTELTFIPDLLQQVTVNVIPNETCELAKGPNAQSYSEAIIDASLCAANDGQDSCKGDSGGPLLLLGGTSDQDMQVGIVSWYVGWLLLCRRYAFSICCCVRQDFFGRTTPLFSLSHMVFARTLVQNQTTR
jgi:hypothetical protein